MVTKIWLEWALCEEHLIEAMRTIVNVSICNSPVSCH